MHAIPRSTLSLVAAACLLVGACSGESSSSDPSKGTPSAAPPSASAGPVADFVVGGDRPVTVHVPTSYDSGRPAPLLILLHGYSASGDVIDTWFEMGPAAERHGFVYATPDGTKDSNGNRFWNATDACCNFDGRDVDDVAYLAGIVEEIQAKLAIDPRRIAFAGHSNGGFMSHRMACERADLVASIVSLAGATYADPDDCAPTEPVSVVEAHGTADEVIHYGGGSARAPYPGAEVTAQTWADMDGCGATSSPLDVRLDLDKTLSTGTDPADTSVEAWSGCSAGSSVQLWTIHGAEHGVKLTASYADALLDFVSEHPKP